MLMWRYIMSEVLMAFATGGALTAIISGAFSLITYRMKKKDSEEAEEDIMKKALRYIMLYIIQERAERYIIKGSVTLEERRSLHKWHDLYHNGLGGNGDADLLMSAVDELHVEMDKE